MWTIESRRSNRAPTIGRHPRVVDRAKELGEVADLHRRAVGDVLVTDARRARHRVEPCPAAGRAGLGGRDPLHGATDAWLERVEVLDEVLPLDPVDEAVVGQVEGVELHLGLGTVEEALPLGIGVVAEGLVGVEEAGVDEDAVVPGPDLEASEGDGALVERLRPVHECVDVDRRPAP
jgi:hypothetical protein